MEFLSDDWFRAANDALAGLETDLDDALVIEHVIEHNGATVPYQLVIEARGCALEKGRPRSAHVTMAQSAETAAALRAGTVDALQAVQDGRVRIDGDPRRLIQHAELLQAIDRRLAALPA